MVTRTVDLRSDTVTKPSESMRVAMAKAEVDDDVLGHDPTAFRLETEMARITGKEAALFVPSGTMGNLISVLVHCDVRGSEVILGDNSHIHIYENGGISTIGGVHPRTVKNNKDGTMDIDLIEAAIRDPRMAICYPITRLICLENTHANTGGRCLPVEYIDKVGELAKKHGLKLHIDGARIFNASVWEIDIQENTSFGIIFTVFWHLEFLFTDWCKLLILFRYACQKVWVLHVGTTIVGSKDFIARAKRLRKTLGGGMRQVGVLCAAALVALKENVGKLDGDHKKAKTLAEGLSKIKGLKADVTSVETNIVYFDILEGANITTQKLSKNLEEHGILVMPESSTRVRLVVHYQISASDVQYTLSCIQQAVTGVPAENGGTKIFQQAVTEVPAENGGKSMTLCVRASKSIAKCSSRRNLDSLKVRLIFSSPCPSDFSDYNNNNNNNSTTTTISKTFSETHFGNLILKTIEDKPWAFASKYWVVSEQLRTVILDPELFIRVLNSVRGRPRVALRLFRWAEGQPGFKRSEFIFCTILEILVQNNLMGSAYSVMERVISVDLHGIVDVLIDGYVNAEVSIKLLDLLLWLYTKESMVEQCLLIFDKMVRNGFLPDVKNCNRILRMLRDKDLVGKTREVYQLMGMFGIKPSILTYNTLLDSFCKDGEVQQALDLLLEMQRRGCTPNDVTYNVLINGLSKKGEFDQAKGLIVEMLNLGLKVSAYTYNPLILGIWGKVTDARQKFRDMLGKNLTPDIVSYNTLIYGYCRLGDVTEAFLLLYELEGTNLNPTVVTYNTIVDGLCRLGELEDAKRLKEEMINHGILPDVFTYTILVNGSVKVGNLQMANEFFDEMLHKGLEPDHFAYTTRIAGELKLGDTSKAFRLQEEMLAKGFPPDLITYNVIVDGLCKVGNLEEACGLLQKMVRDGLMPDHVTYTSIIHTVLEIGHLKKARELFYEMLSKGLSPTVVTYTLLIHAHCWQRDARTGIYVFL
ncbi:hypothetical protein HYC85_014118 [Camellia sinensis]|uniref:Aromatic amino acid beta-eliminating lyase/threonine aldolase domain-containing protein n=1 Tax=Camellia sinensis TaxID=4442 RepID=A0A7J7H7E3_CAMSI|nr:hypothetical protein HYC85_014118 [Camellia sinensis]